MNATKMHWQKASCSRQGKRVARIGLMLGSLLALLATGGVLGLPASPGWAQSAGAQAMADFLPGQVTGKPTERTVQINGQTYPLDKKVTVTDENDVPKGLDDLEPGMGVKFHLKNKRVDHIVILLAR